MMNSYKTVIVAITILIFNQTSAHSTTTCPKELDFKQWINIVGLQQDAQTQALNKLKYCITSDSEIAYQADAYSVELSNRLGEVSKELRPQFANLIKTTLIMSAEAGNPSSQHNLASLYNPPPNSIESTLFSSDYSKFAYWTKEAAARKEPRAIFNLAMRLANTTKIEGFPKDHKLAYLLLLETEQNISKFPHRLAGVAPYVASYKSKIESTLSPTEVETIIQKHRDFDFSTLNKI